MQLQDFIKRGGEIRTTWRVNQNFNSIINKNSRKIVLNNIHKINDITSVSQQAGNYTTETVPDTASERYDLYWHGQIIIKHATKSQATRLINNLDKFLKQENIL